MTRSFAQDFAVHLEKGTSPAEHREFLNRYYGFSRWFYDATRKYYLRGRDQALASLIEEPWNSLVEVGPGTGRNLQFLRRARPSAAYGGLEASDAMLEYATRRIDWAPLVQGFAETADFVSVLGKAPERILFSYCLSMVQKPTVALENARRQLAPGGAVIVVDFADAASMPRLPRRLLHIWLNQFHVKPLPETLLRGFDARLRFGRGRYWVWASIPARS